MEIGERDLHAFQMYVGQGRLLAPPPPPRTRDKKANLVCTLPAPPPPPVPMDKNWWFSGGAAKKKDSLYLEAQKWCSWIRTAFVILYKLEWKW